MKKIKKLLALLLSVSMMFSLVTNANATTARENILAGYAGNYYTSFGDSIAAGYDADDHKSVVGYQSVETAYPHLISQELGMVELPFSCIGFRTNELLISLGEEVEDDYYTTTNYSWMYDADHYCNYWDLYIKDSVTYSKLITVEIGPNDILTGPATFAWLDIPDETERWTNTNNDIQAKLESGEYTQIEANIRTTANNTILQTAYYTALAAEMAKGYASFLQNFPKIIKKLRDNNSWGDIVVVGMYNPYKDLNVVGNYIDITQLAETFTGQMNAYMQQISKQYNCLYVDIQDVETYSIGDTISLSEGINADAHPTHEGHAQIKDKIIDALYEAHYSFPFTDVPEDKWYRPYVEEIYQLGLMTGTSETTFNPSDTITRGQLATILYRMAGEPELKSTDNFSDVESDKFYTNAIAWCKETGIVTGYADGTFQPSKAISRQELALMLMRYTDACDKYVEADQSVLDDYPDTSNISTWGKEAMAWAVQNKLISGSNGELLPKGNATRGQSAKMILAMNDLLNQ